MRIEEAINSAVDLLKLNTSPFIVYQALLSDGIDRKRASLILSWAMKMKDSK